MDANKACVMTQDAKGKEKYVGGHAEKGYITVKTNTFGRFYVDVDDTAPTVYSKNSRTNLNMKNSIMIGVNDNKSDISEWEVYIDGEWQPFDYDYKQGMIKAKLDRLRIEPGEHKLLAIVTDGCGNAKRFEWSFSLIK